jgi:hypothetical protein
MRNGSGTDMSDRCKNAGLWIPAKIMSESVYFEAISGHALYQGTTSVVPQKQANERALAPAALLSSQFGLRAAFGQLNLPAGHWFRSIQ